MAEIQSEGSIMSLIEQNQTMPRQKETQYLIKTLCLWAIAQWNQINSQVEKELGNFFWRS